VSRQRDEAGAGDTEAPFEVNGDAENAELLPIVRWVLVACARNSVATSCRLLPSG